MIDSAPALGLWKHQNGIAYDCSDQLNSFWSVSSEKWAVKGNLNEASEGEPRALAILRLESNVPRETMSRFEATMPRKMRQRFDVHTFESQIALLSMELD